MAYHSITFYKLNPAKSGRVFDAKNTWTEWHLIPSSRPVVVQPTVNYKYIDIPGKSGQLDLTDYLAGKPTYTDRKGSWEFYVVHNNFSYRPIGKDGASGNWSQSWFAIRQSLAAFFDGSKISARLDDDAEKYYHGRVFFQSWKSDKDFSKVVLEYQFDPYYWTTYDDYAHDGREVAL